MIPPLFRSKSVKMKDETQARRRNLLWALPASLILNALIIALLGYGVPTAPQQPPEQQAVNVSLVPPPDQPKPKPAPAPSPKEPKAEKPPESKVEKPPLPEKQPPTQKQPPKPARIEVLKPVVEYGDKDAGPRKSLGGSSAQDSSPPPGKDDDAKPPVAAKSPDNKSAAPSDEGGRADAVKEAEKKASQDAGKQDADKQENEVHDADKQTAPAPTPLASAGSDGEIALPKATEAPQPRPAKAPKPSFAKLSKPASGTARRPNSTDVAASQGYSGLPGVRKLNSPGATGDALATSSMAGIPRDKRVAKLCASALQQQLPEASYFPYLVPLVPLKTGNVVDVPNTAFSTRTTWYNLGFRCEVDANATRVLSFAFNVGAEIPRSEWAGLGLPILY
ncbi:DUF930 domain-containing protein [Mesorhizobium sp. BAC0120]|uniref:DUF930 domain-containing protein n=1 Tax=Mesorhizobium sp. BAC0120 TaxID=3090670 RepID=UPI00298BEB77|nr:DUF930 domain-containing protein [Mesorhizobium sp. BAC0120]MDW6022579.1 DUF930 domain-containing protein [Mesorhizobium sp. BAC0120]